MSPFVWEGWIERPQFVMHFLVNVRQQFDPTSGRLVYKAAPGPAIDAARKAQYGAGVSEFSQYPLWSVTAAASPAGAHEVASDGLAIPVWRAGAGGPSNQVISSSFHFMASKPRPNKAPGAARFQPRKSNRVVFGIFASD